MRWNKSMLFLLMAFVLIMISACGNSNTENNSSGSSTNGTTDNSKNDAKDTNDVKAGDEEKPVTLRMAWWGSQPRHDYTMKVIEMYKQQHPNVSIEVEYANYDDYWKKLAPEAAANELPDIVQMDLLYFSQYAGKGQLEELTPYLNKQIDVTDISENALNGGKVGDGLYGINLGVNALGFQYDPELLKKIGMDSFPQNWTWDDYKEMGAKAKSANLYIDTGMRAEVFFAYYLRSIGKTFYNKEGNALGYEDDQNFVDFFSIPSAMIKQGAAPSPDIKAQIKGVEDDPMVKGKALGIWQWSNQFVGLQQVANRPLAMAPMVGPGMKEGLFLKPSMYFSVSKNSKAKEEAAKFINFFVNDIEANKLILGDRGVPVAAKVKEALKSVLSPAQVQVFDYVAWAEQNSSPMDNPDPIGSAEVSKLLIGLAEQMDYGKTTPEVAAKKFREEANAILAKNK